jgi:N utilization substance protein B
MASENKNSKMPRRAIREAVFKLLFIAEFNSEEEMEQQIEVFFDGAGSDISENAKTDVPEEEDLVYINEKYEKVTSLIPDIDMLLNEISQGWKTSRMSRVDLCVLRLAVYEILYDENIPVSVAINEAVELAKKFGGDDSGSFVNGILGKVAKAKKE